MKHCISFYIRKADDEPIHYFTAFWSISLIIIIYRCERILGWVQADYSMFSDQFSDQILITSNVINFSSVRPHLFLCTSTLLNIWTGRNPNIRYLQFKTIPPVRPVWNRCSMTKSIQYYYWVLQVLPRSVCTRCTAQNIYLYFISVALVNRLKSNSQTNKYVQQRMAPAVSKAFSIPGCHGQREFKNKVAKAFEARKGLHPHFQQYSFFCSLLRARSKIQLTKRSEMDNRLSGKHKTCSVAFITGYIYTRS